MNQSAFAAALLDPAAALPEGIITRTGADATRRFGVYRNNVIVSLIDALADSYTVVAELVGEEFFRAMAREFAQQHPPRSPIMANYGGDFPEFIAGFAPAETVRYLADVARLEWQRVISWHAADELSLGASDIEFLLSDPIVLANTHWHFHPSVALIDSPFAIVSLWLAHQHESVRETETRLSQVDPFQPESALVLRQDLDVLILNMTVAEAAFVRSLLAHHTLAQAVEEARTGDTKFDLPLLIGMLLHCGALVSFDVTTVEGGNN